MAKLLSRRKCWLLAELAKALDCALITVRRLLKEVGYFRSYTHNGKWYTLATTPRFDRDGIWRHKGIGFSKQGSLTKAIRYLIGRSPVGLSARELGEKLQHPCHAVLTILHKAGEIDRIKIGGEFRYLSTKERTNRRQRAQVLLEQKPESPAPLGAQAAVFVLVEYINNPELSFEQIACNVEKHRQITVTQESIRCFFKEQGVKKTPETYNARH
ncbi:MAG: hypothetical protein HQ559_05225 [Lentisphaerae bacterium]|nr:hypothetical protein [Lentisphaerota bacterium]